MDGVLCGFSFRTLACTGTLSRISSRGGVREGLTIHPLAILLLCWATLNYQDDLCTGT